MLTRFPIPTAALLATALALAPSPGLERAWADERDGFDFGPDAPAQPQAPETGAPAGVPAAHGAGQPGLDPTEQAILQEIEGLAKWPNRSATHAAESLLLRGPTAVPFLVRALQGKDSPIHPGAAWVLGKVGEPAHVVVILRAAAERTNGPLADEFFESAYGLDPVRTKEWLISYVTLIARPVFRAKAIEFLREKAGVEDRPAILRLVVAPKPEVRIAGLALLDAVGAENATQMRIEALSDVSPEVSRAASAQLAATADAPLLVRLNALARDGDPRERAYATLALVDVARAGQTNPFEPETIAELAGRRGLLHPDKLVRSASAVGLAFGGLDSPVETVVALLDGPVVEVLIDSVGGDHYRDYAGLVDPAFAALRRLSGLDLPQTATAWAQWWQSQRGRFTARRALAEIADADLPHARVRFEVVESSGRRVTTSFVSEDAAARPGDVVLQRAAFRALVDSLDEQGVFAQRQAYRPTSREHVLVSVSVMNQEKTMAVPADDPRHALLAMRASSLGEANVWQRYRDVDTWPDARAWWDTNARLMQEADPESRRRLLQSSIVYAFDDLPDDVARNEAIDRLEEMRAVLSSSEVRHLVESAAGGPAFGEAEVRAVRFALAQEKMRDVRTAVVDALAARTEGGVRAILADLLFAGGTASVRDAFADPRVAIRGAAAVAARRVIDDARTPLEKRGADDALRPGLDVLSRDPAPTVALPALLALAALGGDGDVLAALENTYRNGPMPTKIAVAEALGSIPGDDAHPLLTLMLAEERAEGSGALRAAALGSIAKTGNANAPRLLLHYLLNDADPIVQQAAADAMVARADEEQRMLVADVLMREQPVDAARRARLVDVLGRMGGPLAAEVLRGHLEDPEPRVMQAAAIRLAEQNDATTVPYLLRILRTGEPAARDAARTAIENVTSVRLEGTGSSEIADRYEAWYAAARGGTDRTWFVEALKRKGHEVGSLTRYVQGEPDPAALPALIRVLRDDDPVLRRNAAIALKRITGRSFGAVERGTAARDAARVADHWQRWWESISATPGR
jgi:HEAT repeat protein